MAKQLARYVISVLLNAKAWQRGIRRMTTGLTALEGLLGSLRVAVRLFAVSWATIQVGGFFRRIIDDTLEFETRIAHTTSIVKNLREDLTQQFRDMAIELSKTSKFTANEVAEGFFHIISAGYSAEESLHAIKYVTEFAQAGLMGVEEATSLLVDAQAAMGLKVKDLTQNMRNMERVSNAITNANILSNATIHEFARALQNKVASTARAANRPLEEVLAGLMSFADQGIKGRVAGNRMNIAMREMQSKAVLMADAFHKLNVEIFDARGNLRAFDELIREFEELFEGKSDRRARYDLLSLKFTREATDSLMQLRGTSEKMSQRKQELRIPQLFTSNIAMRNVTELGQAIHRLDSAIKSVRYESHRLFPMLAAGVKYVSYFVEDIREQVQKSGSLGEFFNTAWASFKQYLEPVATYLLTWVEELLTRIGVKVSLGLKSLVDAWANSPGMAGFGSALFGGLSSSLGATAKNLEERLPEFSKRRTQVGVDITGKLQKKQHPWIAKILEQAESQSAQAFVNEGVPDIMDTNTLVGLIRAQQRPMPGQSWVDAGATPGIMDLKDWADKNFAMTERVSALYRRGLGTALVHVKDRAIQSVEGLQSFTLALGRGGVISQNTTLRLDEYARSLKSLMGVQDNSTFGELLSFFNPFEDIISDNKSKNTTQLKLRDLENELNKHWEKFRSMGSDASGDMVAQWRDNTASVAQEWAEALLEPIWEAQDEMAKLQNVENRPLAARGSQEARNILNASASEFSQFRSESARAEARAQQTRNAINSVLEQILEQGRKNPVRLDLPEKLPDFNN